MEKICKFCKWSESPEYEQGGLLLRCTHRHVYRAGKAEDWQDDGVYIDYSDKSNPVLFGPAYGCKHFEEYQYKGES